LASSIIGKTTPEPIVLSGGGEDMDDSRSVLEFLGLLALIIVGLFFKYGVFADSQQRRGRKKREVGFLNWTRQDISDEELWNSDGGEPGPVEMAPYSHAELARYRMLRRMLRPRKRPNQR
jgi:hypothetical protein